METINDVSSVQRVEQVYDGAEVMKQISKELPNHYGLQRIIMASLDVMLDELHENEKEIVEKYGTELLELLAMYSR